MEDTLTLPRSTSTAGQEALLGNWKLVSWQVIVDGEPPHNPFGLHPKGYLVLTPQGRSIAITTAEHREGGIGDRERAELHRSMLAYTGRYRIEGDDFITTVEASWNGSEQRRHFRVEGDRLYIESAKAPSIIFPGKTDYRRLVWERDT
ncbi:MAG TPA: lipocalin-like domain-containing protein [Xanthobacteraceae bacterium]|jgi:hypothetical protein